MTCAVATAAPLVNAMKNAPSSMPLQAPPQAASQVQSPAPKRLLLSTRAAFYLQGSVTLTFLAGSSAPTPLYALYRAEWGFSPTMLTVAFGIYAIAVLGALLVVGRLSDHVGRRPVLLAAAAAQLAAMILFASADGLSGLLAGRVVQGFSAGAALAAVGAGLLDLDKTRGAVANSVAPMLGTALGGLVAGLMVQYLPAPMHLVYGVLGTLFVLQAIGIVFIAETGRPHAGAWASMRPRLAVPPKVRGSLLRAAPAIVAVWALAGFYASLGPTLVHALVGSDAIVLGGLALFVLAGSGALAVLVFQRRDAQALMRGGASALIVGLAVVLIALHAQSLGLFLLGTAVAGIGFGLGFQGALRSVVALIEAHERAGVLSVLFTLSYLAMGVPAIVAGHHLAQHGDILATAQDLGIGVMVLAAMAWVGTLRREDAGH
ncbi:MAG: MFS transporter [Caldimonas sp.]